MDPSIGASPRPPIDENWSTIWDAIARELPDGTAVIIGDEHISRRELEDRSARLAGSWQRAGIRAGQRVACFLYNRAEYLISVYAAMKIGATPVNVNFRYRRDELLSVLQTTRASVLVFPTSLRHHVPGELAESDVLLYAVEDGATAPEWSTSFTTALAGDRNREVERRGTDELFILTGGTTGSPKAVVWQQGPLLESQLYSAYGALGVPFPRSTAEIIQVAAHPDVPSPLTLPITPLMHAMALYNSMNTLLLGGAIVFTNSARFDAPAILRAVEAHRVSRLIIAGNAVAAPLVAELDRAAEAGAPYDVSSVDSVLSSGMLWSDDTKGALLRHLQAHLLDMMGASEGGPFAYSSVWSRNELPSRLRLAEGAVLLDSNGDEIDLEQGGTGVLAFRGPMPLGYFDAPEKTAEVYRWIRGRRYVSPGDWASFDATTGCLELLGRGSAVVNTGGEKVFPAEVESALTSHPGVQDAVAFGIPDPVWGQVVVAAAAPLVGCSPSREELLEHVGQRLAGYKKPRVLLIGPIERSPAGKVDLPALITRALEARTTEGELRVI